jgi:hypothetical protein
LGTEFIVKKQFGDSLILVELIRGKVMVEANNVADPIILNPNERVVYTKNKASMLKENWHLENLADNDRVAHLVFEKNDFPQIAAKMKSVFGKTIINNSNKSQWNFTGEFNDVTAIDIVENICLLKHLSYVAKGDTIVLK